MIGYTSEGLEIYDLQTGEILDQIVMSRTANGAIDVNLPTSVWLTGYGNRVIINFRDVYELVVLRLNSLNVD